MPDETNDPIEEVKEKVKDLGEDLLADATKTGKAWWKDVEKIGLASIKELSGDTKKLAQAALVDLAKLKAKAALGQHLSQEIKIVESTLQDLAAVASLETMQAMRDVVMASAGHATNLLGSMFGRVLKIFGA